MCPWREERSVYNSKLEDLPEKKANGWEGSSCPSPNQVRTVLYHELKLDRKAGTMVGKAARGAKSTFEAVLAKFSLEGVPHLG